MRVWLLLFADCHPISGLVFLCFYQVPMVGSGSLSCPVLVSLFTMVIHVSRYCGERVFTGHRFPIWLTPDAMDLSRGWSHPSLCTEL